MSVDETIDELERVFETVNRLAKSLDFDAFILVSRLNQTLNNFDSKIADIAANANVMTQALGHSAAALPNHWAYMALIIAVIIVFVLLAVFYGMKVLANMRNEIRELKAARKMKRQSPKYKTKPKKTKRDFMELPQQPVMDSHVHVRSHKYRDERKSSMNGIMV